MTRRTMLTTHDGLKRGDRFDLGKDVWIVRKVHSATQFYISPRNWLDCVIEFITYPWWRQ